MTLKLDTFLSASRRPAAARKRAVKLLGVFFLVLLGVECGRLSGADVPIPFLLIIGSAGVVAAMSGLRPALLAATVTCLYVVWAAAQDFGPVTMTGGTMQVVISCITIFAISALLGYEHDVRSKLLYLLRKREAQLLEAKQQLTGKVAKTTRHLERARGQLGDARHLMEQAMRFAPIGVVTIDINNSIQFINDAALAQFGIEDLPEEIHDWHELLSHVQIYDVNGKRLVDPDGPVEQALANGASEIDFECRIVGFDTETRWSSGYIGPIRSTRNEISGAVIMLVETTIQKEVGNALQQLTRMLFKVQEDERSKLSHELHEQIGQSLTAIKFNLYRSLSAESSTADLETSMAQLDALTNNIRQLSLDLRPASLDDFGLVTAIEALLDRKQVNSHAKLTIDAAGIEDMSDETATVAYRFVQEAVDNAIKHAQATLVAVGLTTDNDKLHIRISDNGHGFDVEAAKLKAPGGGKMGLLFMQERIRQSGGSLKVSSGATTGTDLTASIPLEFGAIHAKNPAGTD